MPRPLPSTADHGRPFTVHASEQHGHDEAEEGYPTREGYPTLESYQNRDNNHTRRSNLEQGTYAQTGASTSQGRTYSQKDPHSPQRNSYPAQSRPSSRPQSSSKQDSSASQHQSHPTRELQIERQQSSHSRRDKRDSEATMLDHPRAYVYPTPSSQHARAQSTDEEKNTHTLFPPPLRRLATKHRDRIQRSFRDDMPVYKSADFKGHFVAMTGEFVGTFMFLWFALGGTSYALNEPADTGSVLNIIQTYYAAIVFGISLLANVWVFYRISGGLFNPAVTCGLVLAGKLPLLRGLLLFPSQIIASICAAALVQAMFPGNLNALTRLAGGASIVQGLFIEAFLTSLLVITVLMLAAEKSKDTFLAPVGIGLTFFTAELVGKSHDIPYSETSFALSQCTDRIQVSPSLVAH